MKQIKELNQKKVAQNIGKLLAESGMSNEEIAELLDTTPRVLYYWQNGNRLPNAKSLFALSQVFNVSIESILV